MALRKRAARITGTTVKEVAPAVRAAKKARAKGNTARAAKIVTGLTIGGPRAGAPKSPKRAARNVKAFLGAPAKKAAKRKY